MAGTNRGVWLLLALGLLGGIGFAFYYFLVLIPGSERGEAREQIKEWADRRWQPLRSCLVGPSPRAARGRDALLLRVALSTGTLPAKRDCTRHFVDLRRPGKVSSGDEEIEQAWKDLEARTATLANAYLDIRWERAESLDKIGAGIDAVDRAYNALREQAGMDVVEPDGAQEFPALPAGVPLRGTEPLLVGQLLTAGEVMLGQTAAVDDRGAWITIRGPADFRIEGMPSGDVRAAADDQPWGMWLATGPKQEELLAGPLDLAQQQPAGPGTLLIGFDPASGALAAPVFAFGRGQIRVVTYELSAGAGPALWVARSLDGGATFPQRLEIRGDEAGIAFRPSLGQRRFDAFWRDTTGIRWLGLGADDAAAPLQPRSAFPITSGDPARLLSCHGGAADWLVLDGAIARAATGGEAARVGQVDAAADVLACDAEHLVLRMPERNEVGVCQPGGCQVGLRARNGPGATFAGAWGKSAGLVVATTAGSLLVVWRGGKPEVLRMPEHPRLVQGVVEWNGKVHILFEVVERGLEIVGLP